MARSKPIDKDTYSTERPNPLELISRMAGVSSYRVPVEGVSSRPTLQTADIVAAVGYMKDSLEKRTAMAVAARAEAPEIADVSSISYRRVIRVVRALPDRPLDLGKGADRWRLRMVVFDALHDLVWPERRRPISDLAKQAKMRRRNYRSVHRCASAVLQEILNNSTDSFTRALWGGR